MPRVLVRVRGARVASWTAAECARVVVAVTRPDVGLAPVVIAVAIVRAAAASASRVASIPLVVSGVGIARVKIEHAALR
jgi:hypothetical protein